MINATYGGLLWQAIQKSKIDKALIGGPLQARYPKVEKLMSATYGEPMWARHP